MVKKVEKIPVPVRIVTLILFIIIAFWCVSHIFNSEFEKKEAAFREEVVETLKNYSAIEKYDLKRYEINLYIKPKSWEKASAETQKAFLSEVYAMIRMDGITSKYLDETGVMLNYYVGNDFLTSYQLVK